jgi:ribonuclease HI
MLNTLYTDGAYRKFKGYSVGSWAYVHLTNDPVGALELRSQNSGTMISTTNNRMEMMAAINGITSLPIGSKVRVYSDSTYVVNGFTEPGYLKKWMNNGWKTLQKDDVENRDLWEKFIWLSKNYDLSFVHIFGHGREDNPIHKYWNQVVDRMCGDVINRLCADGSAFPTIDSR